MPCIPLLIVVFPDPVPMATPKVKTLGDAEIVSLKFGRYMPYSGVGVYEVKTIRDLIPAVKFIKKGGRREIYRGYYSAGFDTDSPFSFSIGSLRLLVSLSSSSET